MLIQLPVETWIEILDWLRRRDLIKKLDSIWDREFTPIVQDWLHKYTRNVKLGRLWADEDGLSAHPFRPLENIPFADVEIPGNIASFQRITIKYLDSTLLAFLRRMRPLFHNSNNIQLVVAECRANQEPPNPTALHHLIPLFGDSIETLSLGSELLQFFSTNYPATLLNAKLLQFGYYHVDCEQILIDWLFTKRADGHARILILGLWNHQISGLYDKILQRFLDPARQCVCSPFFVRIWIDSDEGLPNTLETENGQTGEQLTLKTVHCGGGWHFKLITNCPVNTSVEWLAKKEEEVLEWDVDNKQQVIWLQYMRLSPLLYAEDDANQQQKASGSGMKLI